MKIQMRWYNWFLVSCLPIGIGTIAAMLWFLPSGVGEYRKSPNGRFIAYASNINKGTLFDGRAEYIKLSVVDTANNREVWQVEFYHESNLKVANYRYRSRLNSIDWAQDSSSVTIPVGANRQQITLPVQ
jgi:hypothetical protein